MPKSCISVGRMLKGFQKASSKASGVLHPRTSCGCTTLFLLTI